MLLGMEEPTARSVLRIVAVVTVLIGAIQAFSSFGGLVTVGWGLLLFGLSPLISRFVVR